MQRRNLLNSRLISLKTSGALLWALALGLQILWSPNTSLGEVIGFLEIGAIGIGFNLQTSKQLNLSRIVRFILMNDQHSSQLLQQLPIRTEL